MEQFQLLSALSTVLVTNLLAQLCLSVHDLSVRSFRFPSECIKNNLVMCNINCWLVVLGGIG